jgi:hypothetical protein
MFQHIMAQIRSLLIKKNTDACQAPQKNQKKKQKGQSTVEYIVMLAIVIAIAMRFQKTLSGNIDSVTQSIGTNLTNAISTSNSQ